MSSRELFTKGQRIYVSNKCSKILPLVHTFIKYDNDMIVAKDRDGNNKLWFHAVPAIVKRRCNNCPISSEHYMINSALKCRVCGGTVVMPPNYDPIFEEPPSPVFPTVPPTEPPETPRALAEPVVLPVGPVTSDMVNKPPHYRNHPSGVECIQITEHMNFNIGNAVKYLWRADEKHNDGGMEDLKKAQYYVNREIAKRGKNNE